MPLRIVLVAAALSWSVAPAQAQGSITVVVLPVAVGFALTSGSATNWGTLPIVATTTWTLLGGTNQVTLDAYFTNAAAALAHTTPGNTVDIPSSRVEASVNLGPLTAFTQNVAFGAPGAGLRIFTQAISIFNRVGTHVDTVTLNINLAGYALPADTYSGALLLRAQATP